MQFVDGLAGMDNLLSQDHADVLVPLLGGLLQRPRHLHTVKSIEMCYRCVLKGGVFLKGQRIIMYRPGRVG